MRAIDAVIFDADGTLVATKELIHHGYHTTLVDHGFMSEASQFEVTRISKPVRDTYFDILTGGGHDPEAADALTAYHEEVQNDSTDLIGIYAGLEGLLGALATAGVKKGIFTSGTKWHLERNFLTAGIRVGDEIDAFVTAEDEIPRKPAPDGIELALKKLGGIKAGRSVMVGDHAADMQAAVAAGALPIGITHGFGTADELVGAGAEQTVASLAELQAVLEEYVR